MNQRRERRLTDGRTVLVNRNGGLRKICGCARRVWAKCGHPWHFNFRWNGRDYRFSLDRYVGRPVESKTEADGIAGRVRIEIREGTFGTECAPTQAESPPVISPMELSFKSFAEIWDRRRGYQLVRPRDNRYRIGVIASFVLPETDPPITLGMKNLKALDAADIEAFRHARKANGLSAVTVNHDLKLLRKMFNWGVRNGFLDRSPFKFGGEPIIPLERETPRDRRFRDGEEEQNLLDAANAHLRAVIIAILDTCCRLGEVLSLQWRDVNLDDRQIFVRPAKSKTREGRYVPISARLFAVLELRRLDPSGKRFGPDAYVFGNAVGERTKSVRTAWENACARAGLNDFRLADLRHEAASRFEEAGIPISHVSRILGHANLSTTTRYLNSSQRWLRLAVEKLDNAQRPATLEGDQKDDEVENLGPLANSLQDPAERPASRNPH
jgi:integrase